MVWPVWTMAGLRPMVRLIPLFSQPGGSIVLAPTPTTPTHIEVAARPAVANTTPRRFTWCIQCPPVESPSPEGRPPDKGGDVTRAPIAAVTAEYEMARSVSSCGTGGCP